MARKVTQLYDHALEPAGLTSAQFSILAHLMGGSGLTMSGLAAKLASDPTTLKRGLGPLERRGLVSIRPGDEDRRLRVVEATTQGRELFVAAVPYWRRATEDLNDRLSESRVCELGGLLASSLKDWRSGTLKRSSSAEG